jgi:catechol 2,3-dioxygenase-like lactoylglutathione lyase family enzyme
VKIKSISGITCYVKNMNKTIKFYEALGFAFRSKEADRATANVNWFWIDFLPATKEVRPYFRTEAKLSNKGAGTFLYLSVEDVDGFHRSLLTKGLKPSTKPQDSPWGNREFVIRDPDGYRLVIFKRR